MVRAQGLVERIRSLVKRSEREDAMSAFARVLAEQRREYDGLKQAVAGLLYVRNKVEADLLERRAAAARLTDEAKDALRAGDEGTALGLIAERNHILDRLPRAEDELREIRREADEAKHSLLACRDQVQALEREQSSAKNTLASARARHRVDEILARLAHSEHLGVLDRAREEIARVAGERTLDRELAPLGPALEPEVLDPDLHRRDLAALRQRLLGR